MPEWQRTVQFRNRYLMMAKNDPLASLRARPPADPALRAAGAGLRAAARARSCCAATWRPRGCCRACCGKRRELQRRRRATRGARRRPTGSSLPPECLRCADMSASPQCPRPRPPPSCSASTWRPPRRPSCCAASSAGPTNGGRHRVSYVNAHVLNQSLSNPELRRALRDSDLVYCDGYGVRLAARLIGLPVPHRMTGADWIWGIAAHVPGVGALAVPAGLRPRRLRRGRGDAAPVVPAPRRARHPPRLLRPRQPALRARARAHRGEPARRPAGGHGHAPAGAVGGRQLRAHRRLRGLDRGRAVRLRGRAACRARRTGWPTTASSGSSGWRSSRGGCGGATCSATPPSCTGC